MAALSDPETEKLVRACRTAIGDGLRSVTYFTDDGHDQLYLRDDLERDADLESFVDAEQSGFDHRDTYRDSELGDYRFTIRVFDGGYVTRVIVEGRGVFVTTDSLTMTRFEDVAAAVGDVI